MFTTTSPERGAHSIAPTQHPAPHHCATALPPSPSTPMESPQLRCGGGRLNPAAIERASAQTLISRRSALLSLCLRAVRSTLAR